MMRSIEKRENCADRQRERDYYGSGVVTREREKSVPDFRSVDSLERERIDRSIDRLIDWIFYRG